MTDGLTGFARYQPFTVDVNGITVTGRISVADDTGSAAGGAPKPALLLLHGHPETHLMWHRIADALAKDFTVVAPDLRGYGGSSKPVGEPDHSTYSKREMAKDAALLMEHFGAERGFGSFALCAHDRGARVGHRLLADYPGLVSRAMFLDIAPTLDMYAATDRAFAESYFHWFFLIQPEPLPEALIEANPRSYVENIMGTRHAGLAPFPAPVLDAYAAALSSPGAAHAMCEDYRAAATIDLEHDQADRDAGTTPDVPLRVLWGRHGVVETQFDPLALWEKAVPGVTGRAVDAGHYLPEEAPEEILAEIQTFFA
ncbi:alpha/beta hydrolase [Arthrobacter sp. zg-Y820]|uniref:alpha/beta fold hydrolase n=1 Tax=unclassified Arthrobacter TaxID=235627 RepID=UPI001E56531F|nr:MULTISPECIES: alpha/beta hydrolase [unclassified Arthrobacter]MCC9195467.1 alpha/beta hydrolase [Arthrobacter sp. zg-Y820]MDK1278326.1 alpha/beta hydrolase [Arthrobacter sp. zg.Y820]WIB10205.1 alpha/beta hydrolase [Arthrobacter sp. zg-Y820]